MFARRFSFVSLFALATAPAPATAAGQVAAAESGGALIVPTLEMLVSQGELDAVNLSIVDEKLAVTLAVETHIQIELTQLALSGISHDELKHFTERKQRLYRQLYRTLDDLTEGKASRLLARTARRKVAEPSAPSASPPTTPVVNDPRKAGRRSSIGDIVQNAASQAILRVRLEIADEYARLLRSELESAPADQFDRRYLAVEAFNQMQVLAMLRVFEQQASPELARIIHLATAATETHAALSRQVAERVNAAGQLPPTTTPQVVNTGDAAGR